ncbi:hypothetical protein [Roseimicrobium gellanilyticum]|uniref:hypothetical protein n=1 Tax=Roseimicrobium gellanilyticum TaxID=748857 RepID=UPI000DEB7963|nr:hypothetical protein [Roseimicrobium gellanilyticum]
MAVQVGAEVTETLNKKLQITGANPAIVILHLVFEWNPVAIVVAAHGIIPKGCDLRVRAIDFRHGGGEVLVELFQGVSQGKSSFMHFIH